MVAFRVTAEKLRHQDEILTAENEKLKVNDSSSFHHFHESWEDACIRSVSHIYSS